MERWIFCRFPQFSKAPRWISSMVSGMVTSVRLRQPLKAPSEIPYTGKPRINLGISSFSAPPV